MAQDTNNYVIGRGRIYFNQFAQGTTQGTGELYFGNTPTLEATQATTDLKHYSAEQGLKVQDGAVTLQKDITVQFSCDNISTDNLAKWWGGDIDLVDQAANGTAVQQSFTVYGDNFYQVGATDENPMGLSDLATMTATATVEVAASGTLTFTQQPAVNATVTINGVPITFVAANATGAQVNIGGNFAGTAQNLLTYINAHPGTLLVEASGPGAVLTVTALSAGTAGNSITTTSAGTTPPTWGAATLTGGSAGSTEPLVLGVDWNVDLAGGRFQIIDGGGVADDSVVTVSYTTAAAATSLIVSNELDLYGSLRFIADNPVGENTDYYWPYVILRSNGNFALKGDTWQDATFSAEVLQLAGMQRVYARQRPGAGEGG